MYNCDLLYCIYLIHNLFCKPSQPCHERKKTEVNTIKFLFPVVWKYLGNNSKRKENVTHTTGFRVNWRNTHSKLILNATIFAIFFVMSFVRFLTYHICLVFMWYDVKFCYQSHMTDGAMSFVFVLILLDLIPHHYSCRKERTVQDLVTYWPSILVEKLRAVRVKLSVLVMKCCCYYCHKFDCSSTRCYIIYIQNKMCCWFHWDL